MLLKYSRTALKELSRMYRAVLKHCLLLSLAWGMTVEPVFAAAVTGNQTVTSNVTWNDGYEDAEGNITISKSTITLGNGKGIKAKSIEVSSTSKGSSTIKTNGGDGTVVDTLKIGIQNTLSTNNKIDVKNAENYGKLQVYSTLVVGENFQNIGDNVENSVSVIVGTLNIQSGATFTNKDKALLSFSNLDNAGTITTDSKLSLLSKVEDGKMVPSSFVNSGTITIQGSDGSRTRNHLFLIDKDVVFENSGFLTIGLLENNGQITADTGSIDISSEKKDISKNTGKINGYNLTITKHTFKNTGSFVLKGTLDLKEDSIFENTNANFNVDEVIINSSASLSSSGSQGFQFRSADISGQLRVNGTDIRSAGDVTIQSGGSLLGSGKLFVNSRNFTNSGTVSVASLQSVGEGEMRNGDGAKLTISGDGNFSSFLYNSGEFTVQNVTFTSTSAFRNEEGGSMKVSGTLTDNGTAESVNYGTMNVGSYVSQDTFYNAGILKTSSISLAKSGTSSALLLANIDTIETTDVKLTNTSYIQKLYPDYPTPSQSLTAKNFTMSSDSAVSLFQVSNGSVTIQDTLSISHSKKDTDLDVFFGKDSHVRIGSFVVKNYIVRIGSDDFVATNVDLTNTTFSAVDSSTGNLGKMTINKLHLFESNFDNNGILNGLSELKIDKGSTFTNNGAAALTFSPSANIDIDGEFVNNQTVSSFNGNIIAGKSAKIETLSGSHTDDTTYKFVIQNATVTATSGAQMVGNFKIDNGGSFTLQGDISNSTNIFKFDHNASFTVYTNSAKVDTLYKFGENNTLNMIVDSYRDEAFLYSLSNTFIGSDFENISVNNLYNIYRTFTPGEYILAKKSPKEIQASISANENEASAISAMMSNPTSSKSFNDFYQNLLQDMQSASPSEMKDLLKKVTLMNPETAPVVATVSQEITNQVYSAVSTRLSGGYITAFGPDTSGQSGGEDFLEGWSSWSQILFSKGKYSLDSDRFSSRSRGFALGLENYYGYDIKYGFGYSFLKSKVDIDTGRKTEGTTHTLFVYGEYSPSEWFFNDIMSYSFMSTDEKSSVKKASYDTQFFANQITAGYQFQYDDFDLVPSFGVRYLYAKNKSYNDSLSNKITPGKANTLTGVLGVAIGTDFDYHGMYFRPELRAAYTYDFQHPSSETDVTLANGNHYVVRGVKQRREGYELGCSFIFDISDEVEFSLNYEGHFKKGYRENTGMINFKYEY